ncbi:Serine/threonine-protein kinase PknD [Roseimaritima multifibrata]|uniref:Serine/threonine-protein kinase PknD n=2 Tax=Roseimaritima multifibrata TaxID=1930274 RepID=A0A517MIQ6_9BACT|nr:Serine/threonine-protein kinase PknD [Roseimaritima multifibrata]
MNRTLLETIMSDPQIQADLELLDSDRQTVTVNLNGQLSTPFPAATLQLKPSLPVEGGSSPSPWLKERRLPERKVTSPGERSHDVTDYRLIGELGAGGTAVVYQAHQRAVDREVAVKVLRDELNRDPLAQARFLSEARTIGSLDHPNVIALHELAFGEKGQLFYSMKRIDGTTWAEVMSERTVKENLAILIRVADAIRYAHSRRLLHRDIKPENVMLGRFGEVLLADWGLALSYPVVTENDQTPSIGGTPAYMAPELAAGVLESIGPTTDIYLLGAVLFQMVTGFPPHHGSTLIECIQAAADNKIRPTRVTGALLDIALKAMQTNPEDRFQTVEEFQDALRLYDKRQESVRLVERAMQHSSDAEKASGYEKYAIALNLLGEALEVWPENTKAIQLQKNTQIEFSRRALSLGDYDLALDMLVTAGEGESELAARVRRRRSKRKHQVKREARLQALFSHAPDPVVITRADDGRVVEANEMFLSLFGFELENIVDVNIADLNLWVLPQRRCDYQQQIKSRKRVENFEAQLYSGQARVIDALISSRIVESDNQSLLVTNVRDITLRKRAENELRRSRQRLREFTRLARLGTWEYDVRAEVVHWNSQLYAITGMQPNDQEDPDVNAFMKSIHPEDRPRLKASMDNALKTGEPYQVQARHQIPNGEYRTVIARGQPIRDLMGDVVEIYGTIQDISEQQAELERVQAQTAAMQQLIDWSGEALLAIGDKGQILAASSSMAASLEVSAAQLRCQGQLVWQPGLEAGDLPAGTQEVLAKVEHPSKPDSNWQTFQIMPTGCDSVRIAKPVV